MDLEWFLVAWYCNREPMREFAVLESRAIMCLALTWET